MTIWAPAERTETKWRRYPEYKESGVEWFDRIPTHWEVTKLKRAGDLQGGVGFPHDYQGRSNGPLPFFKVSDMNLEGNEIWMENSTNTVDHNVAKELGAHIFSQTTIIFPKVGAALLTNKRRLLAQAACIDNNMMGFTVARGHYKYFYYWLLGLDLGRLANPGAVPSVNESQLSEITTPLPPLAEQQAIARFLDRETARIDALIDKKERLIELLEEKRTAVISHAVTKGLDPDAPMKDSGVEWLGQIPAHWDVVRLKFLAEVRTGVAKGRSLDGETVKMPYLRVANVQEGYLDLSDIATIEVSPDEIERYSLQPGDVLMNEGGDYDKLGRGAVWEGQLACCLHQNHVFAVRPRLVDSRWLTTITLATYAKHYFILRSKQSTNLASISSSNLQELPVLMPPETERQEILEFLDSETEKLDRLTDVVQENISKLREYRTALISAAVTGKIDVRNYRQPDDKIM